MELNSFRIIAVRVFSYCDPAIMRALYPETTYFLNNDYEDVYEWNGKWVGIRKAREADPTPIDFFAIPSQKDGNRRRFKTPTVSVSAIVGKNGDGKSSLVELILRIINNFGYACGFIEDQESLAFVNGVEARLFYEVDEQLYFISCSNNEVKASFLDVSRNKRELKRHQEQLFYTVVANYSIYAYNARHLQREVDEGEECWINGVFHKNDSYQTPLVLNPMRTDGNFDINKEENLCRQRLMSIYAELGDDEDARVINENKIASGFAFNLEEKSKLETVTLKRYFQKTWKATELRHAAINFEEFIKVMETSENPPARESSRRDFDWQERFWAGYANLWDKYKELFKLAEQVAKKVYEENNAVYEEAEETDLLRYLKAAKEAFPRFMQGRELKTVMTSLDKVESLCGNLTAMQFQRVVLIIDVCELWAKHQWFSKNAFASAIKQYTEDKNARAKVRRHALLYVVYKTINIFSQYKRFVNLLDVNIRYFYLFDYRFEDGSEYYTRLPMVFALLFADETKEHVVKKYDTLKLRQTINYLVNHSFDLSRADDWKTSNDFGYSHYVTFNRLSGFIKAAKEQCDEETIALLPPPIFEGDILIRDGADRTGFPRFRMSHLSSGELQMLNSISTYIYHLRNLNYHTGANNTIEYSNVNLILEEVELYFHPEYQRQYIYRMLKKIEQARLENIKAINIILVTHSPFVLSDIPKNNVLFLKEGRPIRIMQENTFGANIHALLQNGFFLEGAPMGEFAKVKINHMFERLHKREYGEELFEEINKVSEPLLKTQLYQLYSLNKLPYQSPKYKELEDRIKALEAKYNG